MEGLLVDLERPYEVRGGALKMAADWSRLFWLSTSNAFRPGLIQIFFGTEDLEAATQRRGILEWDNRRKQIPEIKSISRIHNYSGEDELSS